MPEGALVYVVDDDASMLGSLHFLLESMGIPSMHFSDASVFIQNLDSLRPGCVLTDLRMPSMSGLELNKALNSRKIAWPVILMTAHLDEVSRLEALKHGFFTVIEKPFSASTLKDALERALSQLGISLSSSQPN